MKNLRETNVWYKLTLHCSIISSAARICYSIHVRCYGRFFTQPKSRNKSSLRYSIPSLPCPVSPSGLKAPPRASLIHIYAIQHSCTLDSRGLIQALVIASNPNRHPTYLCLAGQHIIPLSRTKLFISSFRSKIYIALMWGGWLAKCWPFWQNRLYLIDSLSEWSFTNDEWLLIINLELPDDHILVRSLDKTRDLVPFIEVVICDNWVVLDGAVR